MHIHYFMLKKIAADLDRWVRGGVFGEAFTKEKDQLVIGLGAPGQDIWLRVSCGAPLPYVWPLHEFSRPKRNTKKLFWEIEGLRIQKVYCLDYERVIVIDFENYWQLALKMHGLMSNVLLLRSGKVVDRFRQNSDADLDWTPIPGEYNEAAMLQPGFQDLPISDKLKAISPVFEKHFAIYVEQRMAEGRSFEEAFRMSVTAADGNFQYLVKRATRIQLLLFSVGDPNEIKILGNGLDKFLKSYHQYAGYARVFETVKKLLNKHLSRIQGQIDSFYQSIDTITNERPPEEIGHLIMANLHLIPQGEKEVELVDFYHERPIQIKLKPELNAQQNAEQYYQKQKKHRSRVMHLEEQIVRLEQELEMYKETREGFSKFPEPQELRLNSDGMDFELYRQMSVFGNQHLPLLESAKPELTQQKHNFVEFKKDGFTVLMGKNAKQNDSLTFSYSRKDDLWLHARDTTGSHVIIRNPTAGPIPHPVLEFAAALAALHSKRKGEGLVPVQYTERKYVRKVKNGAAGQVIVDREKVLMVEPLSSES